MSTTSSLASKRIESLLDESSFVEIGALVILLLELFKRSCHYLPASFRSESF